MKKLLLLLSMIAVLSCKTDYEDQPRMFTALGEITLVTPQSISFTSDFNEKVRFTNGSTVSLNMGDRVLVYGEITAESETIYEATLNNLSIVDVKTVTPVETPEEELGTDKLNLYNIIASGDYVTFFINDNKHSLSLVITKELLGENGVMTITGKVYNKASEEKTNNLVSFDLSEYSTYKTLSINLTYTDSEGRESDKTLTRQKK